MRADTGAVGQYATALARTLREHNTPCTPAARVDRAAPRKRRAVRPRGRRIGRARGGRLVGCARALATTRASAPSPAPMAGWRDERRRTAARSRREASWRGSASRQERMAPFADSAPRAAGYVLMFGLNGKYVDYQAGRGIRSHSEARRHEWRSRWFTVVAPLVRMRARRLGALIVRLPPAHLEEPRIPPRPLCEGEPKAPAHARANSREVVGFRFFLRPRAARNSRRRRARARGASPPGRTASRRPWAGARRSLARKRRAGGAEGRSRARPAVRVRASPRERRRSSSAFSAPPRAGAITHSQCPTDANRSRRATSTRGRTRAAVGLARARARRCARRWARAARAAPLRPRRSPRRRQRTCAAPPPGRTDCAGRRGPPRGVFRARAAPLSG